MGSEWRKVGGLTKQAGLLNKLAVLPPNIAEMVRYLVTTVSIIATTRRFFCLPSSVSLVATGVDSP